MPRLAYWDQEEHDKAIHQIKQPRHLQLSLTFQAGNSHLAKKRVRIYVARSMIIEGDEFQEYFLNDEGKLKMTQEYGESLIDVELDNQALPSTCGLDKLTFHWFHPGHWFEHLKINQDISHWKLQETDQKDGNLVFELTFNPTLTPSSAQVSFGNLLSHTFEGPKMGVTPEATVTIQSKSTCQFILHLRDFFKKWMQNYSKPFTVGDEYPIELILVFNTTFDVKPSPQKDPEFVPKSYDGRVNHAKGAPFIGVPSTIPESTIQASVKKKILLTDAMIS